MGKSNNTEVMTMERVERSTSLVSSNGAIEDLSLSGSKRHQLQTAVEYFTDLQTELCNEVESKEKLSEEIKRVQLAIKNSPAIQKLKSLKKEMRTKSANISEISSRRAGALGLCEKQGLNLKKHLKIAVITSEGE